MLQPQLGDLLRVTVKMKAGTRVESFQVTNVSETRDGRDWYVGFKPCHLADSVQCGFGYTGIPKGEARQWGVQDAQRVG